MRGVHVYVRARTVSCWQGWMDGRKNGQSRSRWMDRSGQISNALGRRCPFRRRAVDRAHVCTATSDSDSRLGCFLHRCDGAAHTRLSANAGRMGISASPTHTGIHLITCHAVDAALLCSRNLLAADLGTCFPLPRRNDVFLRHARETTRFQ